MALLAVGTAVGGAILSPFIQVLYDSIASRKVLDVFLGPKLSKNLLRKLKIALLSVNAVLEDAEEKEPTNPTVKLWLDELKGAVYDAVDMFDQIDTKDLDHTRVKTSIEEEIKDLLDTLELIATQKDVIGLRGGVGVRPSQRLPVTSFVKDSDIFGRDDDKKTIINLLSLDDASGNENVRVIAIVGIGGIGKTTLAQLVYNDTAVNDRFSFTAWVSVSQEFDVLRIMKTILEILTSQAYETDNLDLIQKILMKKLERRKFLLVLDDVWNEIYAYWELLSNAFQHGARGSTIIVTTRNENVASTMLASETHYLKELDYEYCWKVFAKHAFRGGESVSYPELQEIGRQIVEKCKGLPLAAKAIGALLRSKRDDDEWDQVLKSELWDLPNDGINILSTLKLSYKYLPSHLKQCFAYCSIFPKDYVFEKDQLVLLWMAEGFLQQSINKTMEEVGDEYFCDLVSRSLFQKLSGPGSGYVMHHLVNDLAIFVSGQLSFTLEGDYSQQIAGNTRHLSYLRTVSGKKFQALYEAKQLRTFFVLNSSLSDVDSTKKVLDNLLSTLTCLRVLSFSECSNIKELPDSISKIIHLRYLDLSLTGIERLPNSICELLNLQTLKLSGCRDLVRMPTNVHKLTNLRHLDISSNLQLEPLPESICELFNLQTLKLSACPKIDELPSNVHKLINLRHLDISSNLQLKPLPNSICELFNLQTLKLSDCPKIDELPSNVHKLINLRHLDLSSTHLDHLPKSICELNDLRSLKLSKCKKIEALPSEITKLTNLTHLDIIDIGIREMPIQLDSLKRLRRLTPFIVGEHNGNIQELRQLVYLREELAISKLQNVQLPTVEAVLKDIKYLEKLVLEWDDSVARLENRRNENFVLDSLKPHTNLKSLVIKFYGAENFPEWVGCPSFSNIASLRLENCKYCHTLPILGQLPSLQHLSVVKFGEVVKVDREFYGKGSSSFGALKVLTFEDLPKWKEWFSFDADAENEGGAFPKLEELCILKCPKLTRARGLPIHLPYLAKLEIDKCPELLASLLSAPNVREIRLVKCNKALLKDLPSGMWLLVVKGFDALESLPKGIMDSESHLQELRVSDCSSLEQLCTVGLPSTLTALTVEFCEKLKLPVTPNYSRYLKKLHLTRCDSLTSFQLEVFPKLYEIKIRGCRNLKSLTAPGQYESDLVTLEIRACPYFVSFPQGGLRAAKLTNFSVAKCERLRSLPDKMHEFLTSLKEVHIEYCPKIKSFPKGGLPRQLNSASVHITGCKRLEVFQKSMRLAKIIIPYKI